MSSKEHSPIGSFLGLELPLAPRADSILDRWASGHPWLGLHNARSAIAYVLDVTAARRLWLPSYFCPHTAAALAARVAISFYPHEAGLTEPPPGLAEQLRPGDAVVVVCFFGAPPAPSWRTLLNESPSVHWIEDRSQALWIDGEPLGQWLVYSPRKVVGVPDGGVLIRRDEGFTFPAREMRRDAGFVVPALMRFEDEGEEENERWYGDYRRREEGERVSRTGMSRLARDILAATPLAPLVETRRANYRRLQERLKDALPPMLAAGGGAPWGYPVRIRGADAVARRLHAERLFASRLWTHSPVGARDPHARAIADELLLLPCDHRYGADDMDRLADAAIKHL